MPYVLIHSYKLGCETSNWQKCRNC